MWFKCHARIDAVGGLVQLYMLLHYLGCQFNYKQKPHSSQCRRLFQVFGGGDLATTSCSLIYKNYKTLTPNTHPLILPAVPLLYPTVSQVCHSVSTHCSGWCCSFRAIKSRCRSLTLCGQANVRVSFKSLSWTCRNLSCLIAKVSIVRDVG